ncbi:MAG: hypothetical protein ACP5DD_16385, partial [Vibrio sp.]
MGTQTPHGRFWRDFCCVACQPDGWQAKIVTKEQKSKTLSFFYVSSFTRLLCKTILLCFNF